MSEPSVMSNQRVVPSRVMQRIVEVATRAPSVHNTQPWRWRAAGNTLELFADSRYLLAVTDPLGRNLTISCGAALHQAQVAAAALGWATDVQRHPDPARPELLARLELTAAVPPATAVEAMEALDRRCTDRRRFTSWPVPEERLFHLARIASDCGARAVALTDESERYLAERLVLRAAERQRANPAAMFEQRTWQERGVVDGVPDTALPGPAGSRGAYAHRFGERAADDPTDRDVEAPDGLIVFFDTHDDQRAWLRAGEGLSAMWLAATAGGLSLVPLTQVVEVTATRQSLQSEVLGGLAYPLILARIGWEAIGHDELVRTPRRPVSDVLELADDGPGAD